MTQSLYLRWPTGLLALALLSACTSQTSPDTQSAAEPAAAAPSAIEAAPETVVETAVSESQAVELTMAKVKAYFQVQRDLAVAASEDPGLGDLAMNISEEDTAQYAKRLEGSAKVRGVLADAGMSPGEFAQIGETLVSALTAQGALEVGQLDALPDGINPAAVEFVKQHKAEIDALMKSVQAGDA